MFLIPTWPDYTLLDSGDGEKLEQFGPHILARPDPQILWSKNKPDLWSKADATFHSHGEKGEWVIHKKIPPEWDLKFHDLRFSLKLTPFRHTGLFPEQANNWEFIKNSIENGKFKIEKEKTKLPPLVKGGPRGDNSPILNSQFSILNLFAYTGGATLAAAAAGAQVCHVDASKSSVAWAQKNAILSGLRDQPIRWIVDDVLKFVKREVRRGHRYDGIIMDPPPFGRGAAGEIWRLENNLPELLTLCRELMSEQPLFFILNAYATSLLPLSLYNLVADHLRDLPGKIEYGELAIPETTGQRFLPAGFMVRWSKK